MKIITPIKRVIDYNVKVRVKPDGSGVETIGVKMSINPFDEIAVEEAIRLKEQGIAQEVIALSVGDATCQETLQHALAMGVDRAILIKTEKNFEPINIAKIIKVIVEKERPQLVLMGKQAIDDDCNQTGQMLAGLLGWPQATFTSKLTIDNNKAQVSREIDAGLETIIVDLPVVVTTDLRLNEPRYITLPNIMKAKRKTIKIIEFKELPIALKEHVKILKVATPPSRQAGITVNSIEELMDALKNQEKVLP